MPYNECMKDMIVRFDTSVTAFVQHWPGWLLTPMLVITNIGQPLCMAILAVLVGVWAWQKSLPRISYSMAAGLAAMGINGILKHYIHRTRPDTLYVSQMYFKTSSFPSGHAFSATVICALLAYAAFKYLPAPWNIILPIALGAFALLVGISRVYVGAHYPTDVIAGWGLGALFAVLIILLCKP